MSLYDKQATDTQGVSKFLKVVLLGSAGAAVPIQTFRLLPSSDVRLTLNQITVFHLHQLETIEWNLEQTALFRNGKYALPCCPRLCPGQSGLVSLFAFSNESSFRNPLSMVGPDSHH